MSAPAAAGTRIRRQAGWETRIILGNGEQLLLAIILPTLALVALAVGTEVGLDVPAGHHRVDVVTPGVMALAVISTSFTGQAISTAFDRRHGVLRLLATTPLGRKGLLLGRVLAILTVEVVQLAILAGVALALGWHPAWTGLPLAVLGVLLGTTCFTAIGLLLGGTVRAEGVLAIANLAWVVFALAGVLVPASDVFSRLGGLLPSGAMANVMRAALLTHTATGWVMPLLILTGWSVLSVVAVTRFFRWDG